MLAATSPEHLPIIRYLLVIGLLGVASGCQNLSVQNVLPPRDLAPLNVRCSPQSAPEPSTCDVTAVAAGLERIERTLRGRDLSPNVTCPPAEVFCDPKVTCNPASPFDDTNLRLSVDSLGVALREIKDAMSANEKGGQGWLRRIAEDPGWLSLLIVLGTWYAGLKYQRNTQSYANAREFLDSYLNLAKVDKVTTDGANEFNVRFWALQHFEFTSWRKSLVPHETFRFWMKRRLDEAAEPPPDGEQIVLANGETLEDSWGDVESQYKGTDFIEFVSDLFAEANAEKPNVDSLLAGYRARLRARRCFVGSFHWARRHLLG